ncbi:MAG TPA: pyridoxal-phosphate dependent enzyme [Saprospiraceae bacterium]|nr:pyridoxal-phosphate dependent enzyme [Saprospiraceae bacterium]
MEPGDFIIPSPLEKYTIPFLNRAIWFKRDDLIHPILSGNKWRKLKYSFADFSNSNKKRIVSKATVYSNYSHALAYYCYQQNIPLLLYVPISYNDSATHADLKKWGTELIYLSRKEWNHWNFVDIDSNETDYFIPYGGSLLFASQAYCEMMMELPFGFDDKKTVILTASGTQIGLKAMLMSTKHVRFLCLAAVESAEKLIHPRVYYISNEKIPAYGKYNSEMMDEIISFYSSTNVLLDPLYTGRLYYGLQNQAEFLKLFDTVYFLHTGGLQSWRDYNQRHKLKPFFDAKFSDFQ